MNGERSTVWKQPLAAAGPVLSRWILGAVFLYLGVGKALHPVEFLKLVRQYDLVHSPLGLNLIAAVLPWLEVWCGVLLILGIAVRGAALAAIGLLVPFTLVVIQRTLTLQETTGQAFCAIRFDCGCGAGEVLICRKVLENAALVLLAAGLLAWRSRTLCLRHSLIRTCPPP